MAEWISVKDKLPQENGHYIVFNGVQVFSSYFIWMSRSCATLPFTADI